MANKDIFAWLCVAVISISFISMCYLLVEYATIRTYVSLAHSQQIDVIEFVKAARGHNRGFRSEWFEYMD